MPTFFSRALGSKILVVLFFMSIFFGSGSALPVNAQADARCWTESECTAARKNAFKDMSDADARSGLYTEPDAAAACGTQKTVGSRVEKVGFCLPAGQTVTSISFGGRNKFGNIGEFIRYIYQYSILIAGILAVSIMIISGVQWTASGGNSATIEAAKTRISGAIIGLLIAVFSYFILYIVNPELVSLRLPQIWMIKTSKIQGSYCGEVEASKVAYYREDKGAVPPSAKIKEAYSKVDKFDIASKEAACGGEYFMEGEGGLTCRGNFCGPRQVCVKRSLAVASQCTKGILSGTIKSIGQDFFTNNADRVLDNDLFLMAVCGNGTTEKIFDIDANKSDDGIEYYIFSNDLPDDVCYDEQGTLGYYLAAEINDEEGILGNGADDFFAIGRTPNTYKCEMNLSKWALEAVSQKPNCNADSNDKSCGCEGLANLGDSNKFSLIKDELQKFLITQRELQSGTVCDIEVNRKEFPDLASDPSGISCSEEKD